MILHIVSQSPFSHDALQRCLAALAPGDAILLTEDGVLAHTAPDRFLAPALSRQVTVFTLNPDAQARGIAAAHNHVDCVGVDYAGFVDLVATADKSVSWF